MSELNIPESWAETKVGEVIKLDNGYAFKSSDFSTEGVPVVRISNIQDGFVDLSDSIFVKENKQYERFKIKKNDLLVAMSGATTGKMGVYGLNEKAYLNQRVGKLNVVVENTIDLKFRNYFFKKSSRDILAQAYGGAQPNISGKMIEDLPFPIPPFKEQERIVQKIETCFKKIDSTEVNLNKAEKLLEKYRESLLAKAFRGELVPQDPNDEPTSVLLEKIRKERAQNQKGKKGEQEFAPIADDEKPFDLPAGWEWVRFEEITENLDGRRIPIKSTDRKTTTGTYPYYGASGIIDYVDEFIFEGEHLLVSEDGANLLARTYPIAFIASGKFWVNNHAHIVKALSITTNKYLERYFESIDISRWVTGAAQPKFNQAKLNSVPIPLPPFEEQKRILKEIENRLKEQEVVFDNLKRIKILLAKNRESLLFKAFEGRLVEQIPSEGTGHELLTKILSEKTKEKETKTGKASKKTSATSKGNKNGKK